MARSLLMALLAGCAFSQAPDCGFGQGQPNAHLRFEFSSAPGSITLRDQANKVGASTEHAIALKLIETLNCELFRAKSPLMYWRFQEGDGGLVVTAFFDGLVKLDVKAVNQPNSIGHLIEPIKSHGVPGLDRLQTELPDALGALVEKNKANNNLLKVLRAVPLANKITPVKSNIMKIALPQNSNGDLNLVEFALILSGDSARACGMLESVPLGVNLRPIGTEPVLSQVKQVRMGKSCGTRHSQATPVGGEQ